MTGYDMDEDRSPIYFLGITSVLMFFSFFLPLTLRCLGALSTSVHCLFQLLWFNQNFSKEKQKKQLIVDRQRSWGSKVFFLRQGVLRCLRKSQDRLEVYWKHPSLFLRHDLPNLLSRVLQPRYVLCAVWLLSVYFFMIQVPKARLLEILELDPHDPDLTASDIKSAYKKLSFKYHPDHGKSERHREKYEQVRKAYKRLKAAQKAQEIGGNEEDFLEDDGERGVSIPIPRFLRQYSVDRPGRTVFFLLVLAFGFPIFLVYHFLFRAGAQKTSARSTGIRSYADYQRYIKRIYIYKDQLDSLYMGLGKVSEVSIKKEDTYTRTHDALDCFSPSTEDDFVPKTKSSDEPSSSHEPAVKIVFEAVSPAYLKIVFSYIDILISTVIEKIVPIDIQGKNKKLFQLYEDKKSIIRKINETVWNSKHSCLDVIPPSVSTGDGLPTLKVDISSNANIRFLRHTQNRYRLEKDLDSTNSHLEKQTATGVLRADLPSTQEAEQSFRDFGEEAEKKAKEAFISTRFLDKLNHLEEEITHLYAEIEKSSFEYLSSYHTRGRKREEKSKKIKKEKQAARS